MDNIFLPIDWQQIDIWNESDPNKIGEALLYWSFKGRNGERGCYQTFDLPEFFVKLNKGKEYDLAREIIQPENTFHCYIYEDKGYKDISVRFESYKVVVAWEWDGDGCLYFRLINKDKDIEVINTDIKCSYTWNFVREANNDR